MIALPGGGPALVQSVDFFTPIVDDPFDWGRIAAANAFSDVYAMGGRPAYAMNLAAWPNEELPLDLLARVLEGGAAVAAEAGVAVVGGHSIRDPVPKYGMAVTGFVERDRIVRNSTMRPGDALYLTKPIGTGLIATAIKAGTADPVSVEAAVAAMITLNAAAAAAMVSVGPSAATDVTGFGLVGHLHLALRASGAAARLDAAAVPLLPGARNLAERGAAPTGTRANHAFVAPSTDWGACTRPEQELLADAQTSGGLLIAVPEVRAVALEEALARRGIPPARVGVVVAGEPGRIRVEGRPVA